MAKCGIPGSIQLAQYSMSYRQVRSAADEPDQAPKHGGIPVRGVQRGSSFQDSRPDAERHRSRWVRENLTNDGW